MPIRASQLKSRNDAICTNIEFQECNEEAAPPVCIVCCPWPKAEENYEIGLGKESLLRRERRLLNIVRFDGERSHN